MTSTSVIIKFPNGEVSAFCVESIYLGRLITNHKIYRKDVEFVKAYINEYASTDCAVPLPSGDGLIAIDMQNDIILDSQGVTGINKMTPTEIKLSKNGNVADETFENSLIGRFSDLFRVGDLKGFEEWQDNGHHLNTKVCSMELDDLIELVLGTAAYGQFVFSTQTFRVETYMEHDREEQQILFKRLKTLNLMSEDYYGDWEKYIGKLK